MALLIAVIAVIPNQPQSPFRRYRHSRPKLLSPVFVVFRVPCCPHARHRMPNQIWKAKSNRKRYSTAGDLCPVKRTRKSYEKRTNCPIFWMEKDIKMVFFSTLINFTLFSLRFTKFQQAKFIMKSLFLSALSTNFRGLDHWGEGIRYIGCRYIL